MGVESDRLVFDYLSRVGDLAQTALPAADRMRLVAQLRRDIERQRGDADSPAAVQRLLGRIGTPDEVVEAAASGAPAPRRPAGPPPAGPPAGSYGPYTRPHRGKSAKDGTDSKGAKDGEDARAGARKPPPARGNRTTPPGFSFSAPEEGGADAWWQAAAGHGGMRFGDEIAGLPGMTGSISIPFADEDLGSGRDTAAAAAARAAEVAQQEALVEEEAGEAPLAEPAARRRTLLRGLLRRGGDGGAAGGGGGRRWGAPMLLVGAMLLVAGAVIGSWIPLGLGWLAGYLSRAYSRTQAKIAVLGIPGAAAAGLLVWVWGRDTGRWGDPIAQGQTGRAILDGLPFTVRAAAVGSAVFLVWRARRSA